MKAAFFYAPNVINIEDVDIDNSLDDSVSLRMLSCSVCSYDVRIYRNGSFKVKPPIVLGHEICAETTQKYEFDGISIPSNTRVCVYPVIPCLSCWYCQNKKYNMCSNLEELGSTINGGFAEYISIPKKTFQIGGVIPIFDDITNEEASLIEPLACCLNGINQIMNLDFVSIILLGDGPIGLLQLMLFKKFFPEVAVTVFGKVKKRLQTALKIGADEIFLVDDTTLVELKNKSHIVRDNPPNLIFVSNNNPDSLELALSLATKNGKIVFFSGIKTGNVSKPSHSIDVNYIHYNQISTYGSFSSTPNNMKQAMNLIKSKEIDVSFLITDTFSLRSLEQALITSENYSGLKSVINKF